MHEKTFDELEKGAKQKGFWFFPWHVFIDSYGNIHKGRNDLDTVSCNICFDSENLLTVLVDAPTKAHVTNEQADAIEFVTRLYADVPVEYMEK